MYSKAFLLSTVAIGAMVACTVGASAGGFAIREQSASSQGASFAGNAAGGDLSSMFWNPAASTIMGGFNTESHAAVILPQADVNVLSASHQTGSAVLNGAINASNIGSASGDITQPALLASSYLNYQFKNFDPNLYLGMAITTPFGLKTEPTNLNYKASVLGRESNLKTFNFNPSLAYKITPNLSIAGGFQFQYATGAFTFGGLPTSADTRFQGEGYGVGANAGLLWTPQEGTSIGLGWRSQMKQGLDGVYTNTISAAGATPVLAVSAKSSLTLPDIVTFSFRQSVAPNVRMLGTVEWSHWSVFKALPITSTGSGTVLIPNVQSVASAGTITSGYSIGQLNANWSDGWMFALGGEWDVNRALTLRTGGAYEISPIDSPTKRLIGIPDNDRIWGSIGGTYKWSEMLSFDLAYSHAWVKDGQITRQSLGGFNIVADSTAAFDIVSASMKVKW